MLGISGGLRIDYIITLEGKPRTHELGGNAVFAAAGARLWVDQVNIISRAGENFPAAWLKLLTDQQLTRAGIRVLPGEREHRTFYAYIDANTRDDTHPAQHFARIGVPMPAALIGYRHSSHSQEDPNVADDLAVMPADLDSPLSAYHLAPMALKTHLLAPAAARAMGAKVISVDPGERYMVPRHTASIERILAQTDVFMPSAMEVMNFFGDDRRELHELARRMRWFAERGPRIVVFKLGSDGSLLYLHDENRIWHFPALTAQHLRVVDVTGAGDSYCGGFVGHLSAHDDPVEAAIAATVSASFAIEDYGALHVLRASAGARSERAAWVRGRVARVMG